MNHRIAVALIALAALTCASTAQAAPFTPELEADYAAAEAWWGAQPIGCSSVTKELVPAGAIGEGIAGHATQPHGWPLEECVIAIAEGPWWKPCVLQEVVDHEYGHLLGFGHSEDPNSIMWAGAVHGVICGVEPTTADVTLRASAMSRAEWVARIEREIGRTITRCKRKTKPAQIDWCRYQLRGWIRMLHHPPAA